MREELLKILGEALERADLKKVMSDSIDRVVDPALQKIVDDSTNPFDNILKSAIMPSLSKELKERLGEEIDKLIEDLKK